MSESNQDWDDFPEPKDLSVSYVVRGLKILWGLFSTERRRILTAAGILVVVEFMGLSMPLFFKLLVDHLPVVQLEGITFYVVGLVVLMFAFRTLKLALHRFVQEPIFLRAIIRLEEVLPVIAHEKLLVLSANYHERENTGRKIAKVSKGVEKLIATLADIFWTLLPSLSYLVLNAVVILVLDWRLGLIFLLPLIPAVWFNLKSYEQFQPVWEAWERKKEQSVGLFCQSILNIRTVQSYVAEKREADVHEAIRLDMEKLDYDAHVKLERYFFGMEMVIEFSLITTIVVGLYFTYRGWSTAGTVAYITITGNATLQNLNNIIHVYTRMLRNFVPAERMQGLLDEEEDVKNEAPGVIPDVSDRRLDFDNVSLVYRGKAEPVFEGFSLSIEPGRMLALVGVSGSGKSTLVNLLLRVYDPTGGSVRLGGLDVRREMDRDWYRSRFAYVPQEVEIFNGSIHYNITYGTPAVDPELVRKAVEAACLGELVEKNREGLLTEVGERGVRLSGGERQRVGIARAYVSLLSGAEVLVLDEATSSLDSLSERVIQEFIQKLRSERSITIVAIAHRLSTIRSADRICVLDGGAIAEMGSHEQLLRMNGLYQKLDELQKGGELRE